MVGGEAPSLPGGVGWVSADFVAATNADDVPVIPSPPPPPPTPTRVPPPTARPPTATPVRRPLSAARGEDQLLG